MHVVANLKSLSFVPYASQPTVLPTNAANAIFAQLMVY